MRSYNPLADRRRLEAMVAAVVEDEDGDSGSDINFPSTIPSTFSSTCCLETVLYSEGINKRCLIISYPHGGSKMVSTGFYSRHHHVGGALYDTPTCMGSCGAPVVTLAEYAATPYVTDFVHSGTVRISGVVAGAGVTSFDRHLPDLT